MTNAERGAKKGAKRGRRLRAAALALMLGAVAVAPARAAALTDDERHWLAASESVLAYGLQLGLPLDIVVQPQPRPGDPPLGLAFVDGRCKFVLSLRGNARADEGLADAPPALRGLFIETMAAHELAHCWRHVQGRWAMLPAAPATGADAPDARLEEGFADLAALAWVRERHPARYAEVLAWLSALRDPPPYPGSAHDTRVWLRLAGEHAAALDGAGATFERVAALWSAGSGLHTD